MFRIRAVNHLTKYVVFMSHGLTHSFRTRIIKLIAKKYYILGTAL